MAENGRTILILNKTRNHKERWRIISDGMGYHKELPNSPMRSFRIAKGTKQKTIDEGRSYVNQMSIEYFFNESKAPLLVRKNARDWLVANGYADWLKTKGWFIIN